MMENNQDEHGYVKNKGFIKIMRSILCLKQKMTKNGDEKWEGKLIMKIQKKMRHRTLSDSISW